MTLIANASQLLTHHAPQFITGSSSPWPGHKHQGRPEGSSPKNFLLCTQSTKIVAWHPLPADWMKNQMCEIYG